MRRLKIQSVKVITTVITAVLLFAPVFMVTSCSDSKKLDEDFTALDLEQETAISSKLDELRETFYEVTHRSGPNLIFVTEEYVIFAEDGYYGCMIYSKDGPIDKTVKNKWCSQEYQRFNKLSDNWYSVYIDLI